MLIRKVKVGQVTNLSEARYCAGMGVDYLSFPASSVDPKNYQEITSWVAGPKFGVEADKDNIQNLSSYTTDFIQTPCAYIDQISIDKKLIVMLNHQEWFKEKETLIKVKSRILLLDVFLSAPISENQSLLSEISNEFDLYIRLNNPGELSTLLKLPNAGISLNGSTEIRAGLKEYPLAEILEQLEEN